MPTELVLVRPPVAGAAAAPPPPAAAGVPVRRAAEDPVWVRVTLIGAALAVVGLLVVVPIASVFVQAFADGVGAYFHNLFGDPDTRDAIKLTLTVVPIALATNVVFGIAAAWAIARFRFPGRTLLVALIDLPFSVSPVVAGLMFVLIFGLQGYLGPFLRRDGYAVVPYLVSLLAAGVTAAVLLFARRDDLRPRLGARSRPALRRDDAGHVVEGGIVRPRLQRRGHGAVGAGDVARLEERADAFERGARRQRRRPGRRLRRRPLA